MNKVDMVQREPLSEPVTIPVEAYISPEYAKAEQAKLWRKVWLQAGRVEDIPEVGNYITFDIMTDSVILVRTAADRISAYHNVCPHRGRKLIDTPPGERNAVGKKRNFICGYHGWGFNLEGENIALLEKQDWQGVLTEERTHLSTIKVDTWGGWIWINLDPNSGPLQEYLAPIPEMLDPFRLQDMRCRWRKWIVFDCNWKVALEAFAETYHVNTTHPEFMQFGNFRGWARKQGLHAHIGYEAPKDMDQNQAAKLRLGSGADARLSTAKMQLFTWENANTNTTQTLVDAAVRLKDELPEGTPPADVLKHWLESAKRVDAEAGVVWPVVDPQHVGRSGTAWQVFPNFQIGHAVNNMLCYSARPYRNDPDKCYFEAAVYQLYPEGQAPETKWEYTEAKDWPPVLQQDFDNMAAVQQGMKSMGFTGTKPNPYAERSVVNLHHMLSEFMGTGAPKSYD